MKITNIRLGFATNSSSSHSIVLLPEGYTSKDFKYVPTDGLEFGWDNFVLSTPESKTEYIAAAFFESLQQSKETKENTIDIIYDTIGIDITDYMSGDEDSWEAIYIDHQSAFHGNASDLALWKRMAKFVANDRVVIFGGNDNEDVKPAQLIPPPNSYSLDLEQLSPCYGEKNDHLWFREDGDNMIFFDSNRGTKVRLNMKDEPYYKASWPELVDLKITDWCAFNCSFCYMGSTIKGAHAPLADIKAAVDILKEANVFEIAIGGGEPTDHPDFVEILTYIRSIGMVPNFTTYSLKWLRNKKILNAVFKTVGGIGFSVHKANDLKKVRKVKDVLNVHATKVSSFGGPKVVAQHALGILPISETVELFESAFENRVHVLLLGFKDVGRGEGFEAESMDDLPMLLKLTLKESPYAMLSVDTAVLQQFPDLLKVLEVNEVFATKEEGKFSMYWDVVTNKVGPSSYCNKSEMVSKPDSEASLRTVFATF